MRSSSFERLVVFWVACVLCLAFAGCIHNKAFWQKRMNKEGREGPVISGEFQSSGLQPAVVLSEREITNSIVGTESHRSIRVSYGPKLREHARLVARAVELGMSEAEKFFGLPLPMRPHIYLLRMPEEQRVIRFRMPVTDPDRTLPWLMVITNTPVGAELASRGVEESVWPELHLLPWHLFLTIHEVCEIRLLNPRELLVMPDVHAQKGIMRWDFKYRTRWFRDGLANYVAYKATETWRRELAAEGVDTGPMSLPQNGMRPFSELARVRARVFNWAQNSTLDYYPAATGLFLLLEQRAGPESIAAVVRELQYVEFPNGKALERLVRQKTGIDLRELAREFHFPDLGFERATHESGRQKIRKITPGGWADRAKLVEGDLLVALNEEPITGMTDLEIKVLEHSDRGEKVSLTYLRNGSHGRTEELPLPGKSRKRLVASRPPG